MEDDKRNIGRDPHIAPGVYYIEKELCARIDGDRIIVEKKEDEDERIRKEIIDFIYLKLNRGDVTHSERERAKKWIAFLEEQGGHSKDLKANLEKEVERYMLNNTEFLLYADSKNTVQNIANYFYNLGKQSQ